MNVEKISYLTKSFQQKEISGPYTQSTHMLVDFSQDYEKQTSLTL